MSVEIHGFCDERFAPLRDAFAANFDDGYEIGSSLAMTCEGQTVVDLWAGHADAARARPWRQDTLCGLLSGTKILMSVGTLILVDRGQIELDAPIARYWPEFAQGGKEAVTVRDALGHSAGVPGLYPPASWEVVKDWDAMMARIAAEPHWFQGRRQVAYHSHTFGHILGEVIRRVDGRRARQFCQEEIAQPLGADVTIGITRDEDFRRLAELTWPVGDPPNASEIAVRIRTSMAPAPDRRSQVSYEGPSGHGFANARSLARVCGILANDGECDGVRLLSANLVRQVGQENRAGECPMFGPIRWGLGFALPSAYFPGPTETSFWWGGMGGTRGLIDQPSRSSMGYVPNNLRVTNRTQDGPDEREVRFTAAFAQVVSAL